MVTVRVKFGFGLGCLALQSGSRLGLHQGSLFGLGPGSGLMFGLGRVMFAVRARVQGAGIFEWHLRAWILGFC